MFNFFNTGKRTLPQQVQKNKEDIEQLQSIVKECYNTQKVLTAEDTTIAIADTNIPADVQTGYLLTAQGLLFKILRVYENIAYLYYYATLPSGAQGVGIEKIENTGYTDGDGFTITHVDVTLTNGEVESFDVQAKQGERGLNGSGINPNLLINGDFRVNQRGQTNYINQSTLAYTVDRWAYVGGNIEVLYNGIKLTNTREDVSNAYFEQFIEDYSKLWGKTITMSYCLYDGTIVSKSGKLPDVEPSTSQSLLSTNKVQNTDGRLYYFNTKKLAFTIDILKQVGTTGIIILWAKLEIGDTPTAYSSRPYAEELAMCQRYYVKYPNNLYMRAVNVTSTQARAFIPLLQQLRTTPTITITNITSGNIVYEGKIVPMTSYEYYITDPCQVTITVTASETITSQRISNVSSGGAVEIDAEIY